MKTSVMQQMSDALVRVSTVIWIPGIGALDGDLCDTFEEEFCEWLPERPDAPIYASLPELKPFAESDSAPDPEDVGVAIHMRAGFLFLAETPVTEPLGETGGLQYSWGYRQTEWLYAASEVEIAPTAIAWADDQQKTMRVKAKRKISP